MTQNRNENERDPFKKVNEFFARITNSLDIHARPNFKEALKQRILEARQQTNMRVSFLFQGFLPKLAAGGLATVVVIVVVMLAFGSFLRSVPVVYAQDNFELTAELEDSLGVDPSTSFILESKDEIQMDFLKQYLQTNINFEFDLEKVDNHHARVNFDIALDPGQMVRFILPTQTPQEDGTFRERPYAWAFQVKKSFQVLNTIPGNQSSRVPLDSGIEVVFSHENVTVSDFEKAFSITPTIKGHVEKNRRSLVFVPDEKLTSGVVYNARIASSLTPESSSETLAQDYTFKFETDTELERGSWIRFWDHDVTVTPNEKAELRLGSDDYYSAQSNIQQASLSVYQFTDFASFKKSFMLSLVDRWRYSRSYTDYVDLSLLRPVGTFSPDATNQEITGVYNLPVALDEGYYGVIVSFEGHEDWLFVQSVSISATVVESDEGTSLVWAHDTKTKQPLVGARVSGMRIPSIEQLENPESTTNENGIAEINFVSETAVAEVSFTDRSILVLLENNTSSWWGDWWGGNRPQVDNDYWGYLYTDRVVYKAGDTVHVWGFMKPRGSERMPEKAKLRLISDVYGYDMDGLSLDDNVEYAASDVAILSNGTFVGEFRISDVHAYGFSVNVDVGDETILSKNIDVQEYRKPVYYLNLTLDKKAVIVGDSVGFKVEAKFFDGTPVVGKTVKVGNWYNNTTVVLSEDGTATGTLQLKYKEGGYIEASLSEPGLEPVNDTGFTTIYPSSLVVLGDGEIKDKVATVNVDTRLVQITDTNNREDDYKNPSPNTDVLYNVSEIYYEKIQEGNTYDFIRKIVRENYSYERRENLIASGSVTTDENGKAILSIKTERDDASYNVFLSVKDPQGRKDSANIAMYTYNYTDNYFDTSLRFFDTQKEPKDEESTYKVGDEVRLEVRQYQKKFEMIDDGKFLFLQAQRGIKKYSFSDVPDYSFVFDENDVLGITVFGVLFTGDGYVGVNSNDYSTYGRQISFDNTTRELDVDLIFDKESYRPGQTANVQVVVKDKNGNPVSAAVNVSAVDEAYFALFPEESDPLSVLYRRLPNGLAGITSSHKRELAVGGAEGGGGGDGEVRSNFVDTSAFVTAQTNEHGIARVDVPLADNVTSWRLTTHAIDTVGLQAGVTKETIATTLPFFISATVQPIYLVDDQPVILASAAGIETKQADKIIYELLFDNQESGLIIETKIGARAHLSLPKLTEGEHVITIKAQTGNLKDAVSYSINVVPSRLTIPSVEEQTLSNETALSGSKDGITEVTFIDKNIGQFYRDLLWMSWRYGDRADEATVRSVATSILNDVFAKQEAVPEVDTGSYQDYGGALSLLQYSDVDWILGAKIALLKDTPFDENRLRGALLYSLYGLPKDQQQLSTLEAAWVYAGLAALDASVLSEVKRFAKQELSDEEQLAIALAYAYAGDKESARDIYKKLMESAKREIKYVWVERETPEETKEANAGLALLAAIFNEVEDRDGLREFVDKQSKGETLTVLEELATVKESLKFLNVGSSNVSFNLRGETKIVELSHGNQTTVVVNEEELAQLQPKVLSGNVSVITSYQKPISSLPEVYKKISVKRRYLDINGAERATFTENELVKVEIKYQIDENLPKEYFQITESIPSGLTPVTWRDGIETGEYCVTYPATDTDQTLTFFVYSDWYSTRCPPKTITYYARVLNAGTFDAEPASIRASRDPSLINFSNEQTITINE